MKPAKTTPTWILELRQKLKEEKRHTAAATDPSKKVKKPRRRKSRHTIACELKIPARPHVVLFASQHRDEPTKGEKRMSTILQEALDPYQISFSSQVPIDRFIADFLIPKNRLIVEVDGEYHFFRGKQDHLRTKSLKRLGYTVIRFTNHEVLTNSIHVRNEILERCVGPHAVFHIN